MPAGDGHERLGRFGDRGRLRDGGRDPRPAAATELQHAFVAQLSIGGQHGVAVDRQRCRQLGRRRQLLADRELARGHALARTRRDLVRQPLLRGMINRPSHGASIISTIFGSVNPYQT
jgi:hypothetical protein